MDDVRDDISRNRSRRFGGRPINGAVDHLSALARTGGEHTTSVVTAILDALPTGLYELGLLRRDTGQMRRFEVTRERILKSVAWLRRENALGREVLFRPVDTRYVLLDDLKPDAVDQMKAEGFAPAAVIETSPGNIQAWIRLPYAIHHEDRTEIARQLAERYGGDLGSVAWDKLGKLGGFTNRKPKHEYERDGRRLAPFVLLREAVGAIAERGREMIQRVQAMRLAANARQREAEQRQREAAAAPAAPIILGMPVEPVADWWQRQLAATMEATGGDRSRADFRLARAAHRAGYSDDLIRLMLESSPHVAGRDPTGSSDYAERTLKNAIGVGLGGPAL